MKPTDSLRRRRPAEPPTYMFDLRPRSVSLHGPKSARPTSRPETFLNLTQTVPHRGTVPVRGDIYEYEWAQYG